MVRQKVLFEGLKCCFLRKKCAVLRKIAFFAFFLVKNLHISKIGCNFAPNLKNNPINNTNMNEAQDAFDLLNEREKAQFIANNIGWANKHDLRDELKLRNEL